MRHLFKARLILTSNRKWHYLFWLVLPIIVVFVLTKALTAVQDDTFIPITVIDLDKSSYSERLIRELSEHQALRLVDYTEEEAYQALETHQLEGVFLIRDGYGNQIEKGKRSRLITGYQTDFTLTYPLIKEIITSIVLEDLSRTKGFNAYELLSKEYGKEVELSYEGYIEKSLLKMEDENLLTTELIDSNQKLVMDKSIIDPFDIWLLFSFLATLFIFDWLILENTEAFKKRLLLSRFNQYIYFLFGFLFMTSLTVISDLLFYLTHTVTSSISVYLTYRLTINLSVFFLAQSFTKKESYYKWTLIFFLLFTLASGLLIPIDRLLHMFKYGYLAHPVYLLKANELIIYPLFLSLILVILSFVKGGFFHARN